MMMWSSHSDSYIPWFSPCLPQLEVDPPAFVPEQHCCCCTSSLTLPLVQSQILLEPVSLFYTRRSTRKMMYFTRSKESAQVMQESLVREAPDFPSSLVPSFLFTVGSSSKALWYERSYDTVLEMSQTSHITSQPPLMKRLSAKALCCASGMLSAFQVQYVWFLITKDTTDCLFNNIKVGCLKSFIWFTVF